MCKDGDLVTSDNDDVKMYRVVDKSENECEIILKRGQWIVIKGENIPPFKRYTLVLTERGLLYVETDYLTKVE